MILEVKSDYGKLQTFKSQTNLSMYIYVNVHMLLFYPVLEGRQYQSFETLISPFYQVHLPQSVLSQRDLLLAGVGVQHIVPSLEEVPVFCIICIKSNTH